MKSLSKEHKRKLSISQRKRFSLNRFPEEVKKKISEAKKIRCYEETEEGRIQYFKKLGYQTLINWEKELKKPEIVLEKINNFKYNLHP
ncbi:hypothetical protein J4443_03780 [Candidatus Woesearchaeota archaeon]|nr:hypothetical protein [Candidatus Woesearchaeota archaeon]